MNATEKSEETRLAERSHAATSATNPGRTPVQAPKEPSEPPVILVDASNVAYGQGSGPSQAKVENLTVVLGGIRKASLRPVALADASLRHKINAKNELEAMFNSGEVVQVPAGTSADDYLWQLWKRHRSKGERAFIVTNDQFPTDRAREEGFAENPRITFMLLGGEVFFQPPLEQLNSRPAWAASMEQPQDGPTATTIETNNRSPDPVLGAPASPHAGGVPIPKSMGSRPSIEKLVGAAMRVIASSTEPPGGSLRRLNFAGVAHDLHEEFGGDYVAQFGLRRPKDLASLLSERGFVTITFVNATMYVEPTPAFDDHVSGLPRLIRAPAEIHQTEEPVGTSPPVTKSVPSESTARSAPEVIAVSAGAPAPVVEIGDPETFLKLAIDHHALHIFHWPCGVYSNEHQSDFRSGGEFFFTSNGTSFRLWGRAYKTVEDFVDARRKGFRGADRESVVGDRYGNHGVSAIHDELEELVDPHRDGFVPQEGDVYYCARSKGFNDFGTYLADRQRKSNEESGYSRV